ncbi:hypothetical protein Tco_0291680 [Tanacetum coccineum]
METSDPVGTPMEIKDKLDLDQNGSPVNATKYRSMIGALMYLTSSRPDIVHATCLCARYQAKPTEKHLKEVKRIFCYLWGTVIMGLWYMKDSGFELTGFLDADYAGCTDTVKISRKRSKPDKHGHGKGKRTQEPGECYQRLVNHQFTKLNLIKLLLRKCKVFQRRFENRHYVKANDAILRNMQNQGQGLQNQMTNLTEMLSKFVNSNTASTSSSGSLPSNTVTNPKEDLKGITIRSGVVYQGPTIPTSSPKVVERRTEVTKDTVFPTNNRITKDVQPPVVPVENQNPVSEPVDAPVSAPMPSPKPSIPYPSRQNDEKHRENANEQKGEFFEIFKMIEFSNISFMDALTLCQISAFNS